MISIEKRHADVLEQYIQSGALIPYCESTYLVTLQHRSGARVIVGTMHEFHYSENFKLVPALRVYVRGYVISGLREEVVDIMNCTGRAAMGLDPKPQPPADRGE